MVRQGVADDDGAADVSFLGSRAIRLANGDVHAWKDAQPRIECDRRPQSKI